ncbi:MAG: hypothetical protein K0S12_1790 [Bacteroidetes bacterium]|nr:hypothetical protein [Bacteroidota bacterium]
MRRIAILIFCVLTASAFSQRIQGFNVFTAGTSVGIRFTVTKGSQCSGYTIYHSTDSINFFQIYNYPGVCGDVNTNQDYSYTHTSPALNQVNYYKIDLFPVEMSGVQRIYVSDQPRASMLIYPNPIVNIYDVLNIKIFNVANVRLVGGIYNQFGKPVKTLDLTTKIDLTSAFINDLENGMYVVWLNDGTNVFSSKFIINR